MATGLIYSPCFRDHKTGPGFPETPQRLTEIYQKLEKHLLPRLTVLEPGSPDSALAELVHTSRYIDRVRAAALRGDPVIDCSDNPICKHSYSVALLALSGVVTGVEQILKREFKNAMVLLRPPGHHAEIDQAMGFCLFNNAAVAARYLQKFHSVNRIMIIDFDVHHGNGTQHIFEEDSGVFYLSLHQHPFYPGTGLKAENGIGKGKGFTLNFPLPAGSDDQVYFDLMKNEVTDAVLRYQPEFLILSSGFDAHENDPVGGMQVSSAGFQLMTRSLVQLGRECCEGRILSILEGGYHLKSLAESVELHITELLKA
ncbi:MAG: histone deacetylase [Fidelibacterota bacterium]